MISAKMLLAPVFCIAFGATAAMAETAATEREPTKAASIKPKAKSHKKQKSAEACDAAFYRLKEEEDAVAKSYLQQCFYDEACNQQDRCDWYQSLVDYSSGMEIASHCARLPNSAAEQAQAHHGVETNQALLDQKCTGDLGAQGRSVTPADIKLRRARYKTRMTITIGKGASGS